MAITQATGTQIKDGTVGVVDLSATGTPSSTTFLRGDNSWATPITGVTLLSVIGTTPNVNGATITGTTLNLQPASSSFGGIVTTGIQTFGGNKTIAGTLSVSGVVKSTVIDTPGDGVSVGTAQFTSVLVPNAPAYPSAAFIISSTGTVGTGYISNAGMNISSNAVAGSQIPCYINVNTNPNSVDTTNFSMGLYVDSNAGVGKITTAKQAGQVAGGYPISFQPGGIEGMRILVNQNVIINSLQSGGVAPTSTGTIKYVTVDSSGVLSNTAIPVGGVGSGITRSIISITTTTTGAATASVDYVYLCTGTFTFTLPTAVGNTNQYTIKNVGTGTITITTTAGQTIDTGTAPITISRNNTSLDFLPDGSNWKLT